MKLFRKSPVKPDASPSVPDSSDTASQLTPHPTDLTPEEEAQRWFRERFSTEMPDEMTRMLRRMARWEARKQKVGEKILDINEKKRIDDHIRLLRTRLNNIEQTIDGLQAQKEWLLKFNDLKGILEKNLRTYYETSKKYNAHLLEIKELERFEQFEPIRDRYQSMKTKQEILALVRQLSGDVSTRLTEAQALDKGLKKQADTENKKYREALSELQKTQQILAEGYQLQALVQHLDAERKEIAAIEEQQKNDLATLTHLTDETNRALNGKREEIAQQQQAAQELAPHQIMLENGEIIQIRLDYLQALTERKDAADQELERILHRQQEENEKLNKLFVSSQNIDAQIKTLRAELQVHMKSIVGQNSYALQQRAIDLKSRREVLLNAALLWRQITEGYIRTDEKSQELIRMNRHYDMLRAQIAEITPEVKGLEKLCEETNYAYILSKSRDVMELRKDLQEGVNCSVCGATHHPYHSDTLPEQSKLISNFKTQYDQASTQLKQKKARLAELTAEQQQEEGRIDVARKALETYKHILHENVAHWDTFSSLDNSLKDCSSSINFEARRIVLQQLTEKTAQDAETAGKELDTFNYHQANINSLNGKIAEKEREKDETVVRLNEVNGACQVMAYRVEQLQRYVGVMSKLFKDEFEKLDKIITVSNWYQLWTDTPETLRMYVRGQRETWLNLKKEMEKSRNEEIRLKTSAEHLTTSLTRLKKEIDQLNEKAGQMTEYRKQVSERMEKLFPDDTIEDIGKKWFTNIFTSEDQKENTSRQSFEAHAQAYKLEGYLERITHLSTELEKQIAAEHSEIDVWIRKYNAMHSPVQFPELERAFNSPTDWNVLRLETRKLTLDNLLAEERTNEARLTLAAHQASSSPQQQEGENRWASLNTEIARLKSERQNIMVEIASLQAQLDAHEEGLRQIGQQQ